MCRGLKKYCIWIIHVAILICAATYLYAQSERAKSWTLELGSYGWQPLPKGRVRQSKERLGIPGELVSIDHKGRILVGFTARDNDGLAIRERPTLAFHILRFTREGELDSSFVLPTKNYFTNGFYLGPNDQILARVNDTLQVLLKEQKAKESTTWQTLDSCAEDCDITRSFSRRTLILRTSVGTDHTRYTIIDTSLSPPRVVQTCSQMAFYGERITDRFAYWAGSEGVKLFTRRFPFCDVDHPQGLPMSLGGMFFALNDDTFLRLGVDVKSSAGEVKVVRSDGRVKFRHELPKHDIPLHHAGALVSADDDGDRFAFIADTWSGGSRVFDISAKLVASRILVFNDNGKELASVAVPATTPYRDFDFSLGPDGLRLATLDEGVLTVVDLN